MGLYNERAPASRDFQKREMRKVRKTWTKYTKFRENTDSSK